MHIYEYLFSDCSKLQQCWTKDLWPLVKLQLLQRPCGHVKKIGASQPAHIYTRLETRRLNYFQTIIPVGWYWANHCLSAERKRQGKATSVNLAKKTSGACISSWQESVLIQKHTLHGQRSTWKMSKHCWIIFDSYGPDFIIIIKII